MGTFNINIADYKKSIFSGTAESVSFSGADGVYVITENHIPFMSFVSGNKDVLIVIDGKEEKILIPNDGFCFFEDKTLNIFC